MGKIQVLEFLDHLNNSLLTKDPKQSSAIFGKVLSLIIISGREYGTSSIEFHVKSCIEKWEIEENKKPNKDRRPVPEPPKNFDEMVAGLEKHGNTYELDEYNKDAFK